MRGNTTGKGVLAAPLYSLLVMKGKRKNSVTRKSGWCRVHLTTSQTHSHGAAIPSQRFQSRTQRRIASQAQGGWDSLTDGPVSSRVAASPSVSPPLHSSTASLTVNRGTGKRGAQVTICKAEARLTHQG
ncbi:hypothetical protein E2C01_008573 [Portunus trituberculatus]|uniref:Uncharacterized protein n=1 Tax=Portunus trituberculatus TaxID=210409 RepID=A0A5B7D275_PORTR|nr:hypothetical protein [Portunus trituberculatus]